MASDSSSLPPAAATTPPAPVQPGAVTLAVFLTVLISSAFFFQVNEYANSKTRWALIRVIVDDHTLSIDRYHTETVDKSLVNGHYYCDKAPGSSLWGVPAYWLMQQVSHFIRPLNEADLRFWTRLWVASLPTAVSACLLLAILRWQSLSTPAAATIAVLSVLGTCAWPYSTVIYGHQLAAMFVVAAFARVVDRGQADPVGPSNRQLAAAGLCVGLGVMTEYPVAIAGLVIGLYALWRCRPRWRVAWFLAGGVPAALALMAYNVAAFGAPLVSGYDYEAAEYFQTSMAQGVGGVTYPRASALWLISGSISRGLFSGSPFLLLAFPGFVIAWRSAPRRSPWVAAAAIGIAFFLFNASYYSPEGGNANGPRHLLPAVPLVALLAGGVFLPGQSRWWQVALAGLSIPAIFRQVAATAIHPHIYQLAFNPWRDFWQPLLVNGYQSASPAAGMGLPIWGVLLVLAVILLLVWIPIVGNPLRRMSPAAPGSVWRKPAAYLVIVLLAAVFLAPNWLLPLTPGAKRPLYVGTTLYNGGLYAQAKAQFVEVSRMPTDKEEDREFVALAWSNLARMAKQEGELELALANFREGVRLNPKDKDARFEFGVLLAELGHIEEARTELEETLRLDPEFHKARRILEAL